MNWDDLHRTLLGVAETGKLGQLVSLRLHAQFANSEIDLAAAVASIMPSVQAVFGADPRSLAAQSSRDRQLSLLLGLSKGQTVFLTLGCGSAAVSKLDLLLIGNHGISRLEGGELADDVHLKAGDDRELWSRWIESSLRNRQAITREAIVP